MKNIGSLGHYSDLGMRYLRLIVVMITSLVLSACDFPSGSSNDNPNSNPELPAADTTPPIIAFIAPEDGETLTDRRPVFTLAYSDNVSINTSFLIVLVNGQANTLDCSISLTTAECAPFTDLALGDYSIVASIADISGNGAATEINIKIEEARDTVAPTLMITAPTDGSSSTNSRPDILVSYSDETGLDLSTFTALFDGEDVTERCLIETEGASCVTEEDYAVGTHTVAASIQDLAGNEATNSIVFSVDEPPDTNSPSISIDTPSDGAILTDRRPTLIISFTDDREIDTSSFSLFLNDQELKSDCTVSSLMAICRPSSNLPLGVNTFAASVQDEAGNQASDSVSITLVDPPDTTAPIVTIESPRNGDTVQDFRPLILVSYQDNSSLNISTFALMISDQDFTSDCSIEASRATCRPNLDLPQGNTTISATISDATGNTGSNSISIVIESPPDTTPPNISIASPADGTTITDRTPTITVEYSDDTALNLGSFIIALEDQDITSSCTISNASAECLVATMISGSEATIETSVSDTSGNTSAASSTFTVGTVPTVSIEAPTNGLLTKNGTAVVTGSVSDQPESVTVNGTIANLTGASFSATVNLREGENMVTATATLPSGLTASDSIEIVRDVFAPTVSIATPKDGFVSVDKQIAIAGLVNDIVSGGIEAVVTVNGSSATVSNGSFVFTGFELVNGPNEITVEAEDAAGNKSSKTISVIRRTPAGARITVSSGDGQSQQILGKLSDPLTVRVVDNLGNPVAGKIVKFTVARNNGLLFPVGTEETISSKSEIGRLIDGLLGPENTLTSKTDTMGTRTLSVPTDGNGFASAELQLGNVVGSGNNRVSATVLGVAGEVEFCHTANPAPAARIIAASGQTQRGAIGQPLPEPMEALITDTEGNPINGIEVTFKVIKGSGTINGETEVTRLTNVQGMARTVLTLGLEEGVSVSQVIATATGVETAPATYTASAFETGSVENTTFTGVVLDNALTPIPGTRIHIPVEDGDDVESFTDEQGLFELTGVPVGFIHLEIDPTNSPRPESFPPLEFETTTVAGISNQLGQPILIPPTDTDSSKIVGGDKDVSLLMSDVPGMSVTVLANSAQFPDGASTGRMSISQVAGDKVPMPPPDGIIFTPPVWTFQPAGVKFDPPARVQMPNSDGLAPGTIINLFQFDHTIFEFINIGKATVSEDGLTITSDLGFGISRSGWGGGGPPPPPPNCTGSCGTGGNSCSSGTLVRDASGACRCEFTNAPVGTACEMENVCVVGAKTCNASGTCDATPAQDGTSCEDGLFCTSASKSSTGPDTCKSGQCQSNKVDPRNELTASVDLEDLIGSDFDAIDALFDIIFNDLDTEDDEKATKKDPEFDIEANLSRKTADVCCEESKSFENLTTLSGSVSLNYGGSYTTPVVRTPQGFNFSGTFSANVGLEAKASSSAGICNDPTACSEEISGEVSGSLSGSLNAAFIDERILNIMPTVNAGSLSGTYKYGCGKGKYDVCVGPVEVFVNAELLSLFNFRTGSYEIIDKACF